MKALRQEGVWVFVVKKKDTCVWDAVRETATPRDATTDETSYACLQTIRSHLNVMLSV